MKFAFDAHPGPARVWFFVDKAWLQQSDIELSSRLSGQSAIGGARTHDRKFPVGLAIYYAINAAPEEGLTA
ncbi:hypothetical protein PoB_003161500 [Plakobranchus ocellatus]|uniref:Uncharacterized protein n=1 Tax=Plakobranchus ocellatus TaxID=259542 RepID=A0AAV4AAB2_9GAST|nr:hypothetical protein PoB_003161500 [Plakobranchus ocellatus]